VVNITSTIMLPVALEVPIYNQGLLDQMPNDL